MESDDDEAGVEVNFAVNPDDVDNSSTGRVGVSLGIVGDCWGLLILFTWYFRKRRDGNRVNNPLYMIDNIFWCIKFIINYLIPYGVLL